MSFPRKASSPPRQNAFESAPAWLAWCSLGGRLILAGVLGYAALTKIGDPAATVRAVRAYRLLPDSVALPLGHALPGVELAIATLLVFGIAVRFVATVSAFLIAMFVLAIASAAARGLRIDCGCFGGGGLTEHPQYGQELLRDGALLGIAIAVALIPRSRLAIDVQPALGPQGPPADASRNEQRRHRTAQNRYVAERATASRRMRWHRLASAATLTLAAIVGVVAAQAPAGVGRLPTPAGVTTAGGVLVGAPTAARHLVIYEDPQCPVCAEFESRSGPVLAKAVAQKKINVEYRMRSFLGPESVRAVAALGASVEQNKFDALRAALFVHQPAEHSGGYSIATLLDLGRGVGLTDSAYVDAVKNQTFARWARAIDEQASRDGNVGTPELRLDGKTLGGAVVFDAGKLAAELGVA